MNDFEVMPIGSAAELERLRRTNARLLEALLHVMRYPNIRLHIGRQISDIADAAITAATKEPT